LPTTIPIRKTLALLICNHPGLLGACTVHSIFLILSRAPVKKTTKNKNFDRRLLSTILDSGTRRRAASGTRPYMPGKRATSRVERAIMLLTALKPDRMGAERACLLNKKQRRHFVVTHSLTHSEIRDQRSDFLRITPPTKRQKYFALSAQVPSFERDRPPGGLFHIQELQEHRS